MKRFSFLLVLLLAGCGLMNSTFDNRNYEHNSPLLVNTGENMIVIEQGLKSDAYGHVWNGIRQELVYSGKDGSVIFVDYREYNMNREGTFIKDGFTQHLRYDLSESEMIAYKDLKIRVIEVTGNAIRFEVIP